jgi:radical SAM/Cys-rich protein
MPATSAGMTEQITWNCPPLSLRDVTRAAACAILRVRKRRRGAMRNSWPLLDKIAFPPIRRGRLDTLQVNVGYRCNQSCVHCHVDAGPSRSEEMSAEVADLVLAFLEHKRLATLDITGGAPELNAQFRRLVRAARDMGARVMDRCNLTILEVAGQEDLADFLAGEQVEIVASMPCYLEDNVDRQRGKGVFDASIRGLKRLNALGYGREETGLVLNLVYNPQGPSLPPPQQALEADYKRVLGEHYGVAFTRLYTLTNMPIQRFGAILIAKGELEHYLDLLRNAHLDGNLEHVMCRNLISVDWQGYVYDCDFNQMLDLPLAPPPALKLRRTGGRVHLSDLIEAEIEGLPIRVAGHCYGCTAGQGSSCGGALREAAE